VASLRTVWEMLVGVCFCRSVNCDISWAFCSGESLLTSIELISDADTDWTAKDGVAKDARSARAAKNFFMRFLSGAGEYLYDEVYVGNCERLVQVLGRLHTP